MRRALDVLAVLIGMGVGIGAIALLILIIALYTGAINA